MVVALVIVVVVLLLSIWLLGKEGVGQGRVDPVCWCNQLRRFVAVVGGGKSKLVYGFIQCAASTSTVEEQQCNNNVWFSLVY